MALPAGSPAVDAIPPATSGCTGSTDQRAVTRPQGAGCDVGAYELISSGGGIQPPLAPTGLTVTKVTSNSVSLSWNASTGPAGVTGYTVYRDGAQVGSTGGAQATTFTDVTAAPSTTYSYTADAVDGSSHSPRSQPVSATTPAAAGIGADCGPTAAVGAGELVVGGILTGGSPGTVAPGTSQGQAFTMRAQTSSGSAGIEDILASAAGAQDARATFASATDWYAVAAVFHPASG